MGDRDYLGKSNKRRKGLCGVLILTKREEGYLEGALALFGEGEAEYLNDPSSLASALCNRDR